MYVKVSSLIKWCIALLMVMALSYTKLLGNLIPIFSTNYMNKTLAVLYLILIFMSLILTNLVNSVGQPRVMLIEIFLVVLGAFVGIFTTDGGFSENVWSSIVYAYVLLAVPLLYLLELGEWDLHRLLRTIIVLTIGSYLIRYAISTIYSISGNLVYENIALEAAAENWIRNDVLRINPPCFGLFMVAISFYFFLTSDLRTDKFIGMIGTIVAFVYTNNVHQARSVLIYQIFVVALMLVFQRVSDVKKLVRILVIIVIAFFVLNSSWAQTLMDSFSITNEDTGASTLARMVAIEYFGGKYSENPIFGIGYTVASAPGGGNISDIGFLGSIFKLGIPLIMFYIVMFVRGFYVWNKARKVGNKKSLLVLGMTIQIIMTGINIDCFSTIYAFAVPFYIAIVEFVSYECNAYESDAMPEVYKSWEIE